MAEVAGGEDANSDRCSCLALLVILADEHDDAILAELLAALGRQEGRRRSEGRRRRGRTRGERGSEHHFLMTGNLWKIRIEPK
jgi:hypothetical protein